METPNRSMFIAPTMSGNLLRKRIETTCGGHASLGDLVNDVNKSGAIAKLADQLPTWAMHKSSPADVDRCSANIWPTDRSENSVARCTYNI